MCNPKETETEEENNFCGLALIEMNERIYKGMYFSSNTDCGVRFSSDITNSVFMKRPHEGLKRTSYSSWWFHSLTLALGN